MEKYLLAKRILPRYKMPPPPTDPVPRMQSVNTLGGVQRVLADSTTFKAEYGPAMRDLTNDYGFFLAFDDPVRHDPARAVVAGALWRDGRMDEWAAMYERMALALIDAHSWGPATARAGTRRSRYVDVVRDVLNVVPVHWVCEEIVSAQRRLGRELA